MQTDIIPPKRRSNTKNAKPRPMRSQRLRGYSLDSARGRLLSAPTLQDEKPITNRELSSELPTYLLEPPESRFWRHWSKRQKFDAVGLVIILIIASSLGGYYIFHKSPQAAPAFIAKAAPKPLTVPSPLTGVRVEPSLAKRPVTGIMIENSLDARPQSGLQSAGVVFEAIAEGGITRFLGLFQEDHPQYIGPVRSLRPYYYDFAQTFDASVAHVGGSPKALRAIRGGGKDLDQFFNAGSYWRQSTRVAPHNVYTSFKYLDALNKRKGYKKSTFVSWPRKLDHKLAKPTAINIDFNLSSFYYNVHYSYDLKTNSYYRREGGQKHLATSSPNDHKPQQLHPKVVLALVMPYSIADSAGHSAYGTTGKGRLYVFQDGGVTVGIWKKKTTKSQFSFLTGEGQPIRLNAGQSWVSIVRSSSEVHYSAK